MIREDILPFGRFKYAPPYTGSYLGMRYRIVHPKPAEGEENLIYVDVWKEPLCYEKVNSEELIKTSFEYSQEGYENMLDYLEEMYTQNKDRWTNA